MNADRTVLEKQLLGELRAVFGATRNHVAAVKRATGIGAAMLWVLHEVVADPGISPGEVATRLNIHPTTASNLCSGLKRRKFLEVRRNPKDGRASCLHATTAGKRILSNAPEPRRGVLPTAIESLDDATLKCAVDALAELREIASSLGHASDSGQPFGPR